MFLSSRGGALVRARLAASDAVGGFANGQLCHRPDPRLGGWQRHAVLVRHALGELDAGKAAAYTAHAAGNCGGPRVSLVFSI